MQESNVEQAESSALRVALWRALHSEVDAPPHVLEDAIGLRLADPPANWRERGDMHPQGTRGYRAAIVARARYIDDLVAAEAEKGVAQYVILGAGLDTFAQRNPEVTRRMTVFEIDQSGPQAWKRRRLVETGLGVPDRLRLVPVDFEAGQSWREKLIQAGFDPKRPAVVASTGVSMYLTREANLATLRQIAAFAPGSTLAMTFLLTLDLLPAAERPQHQAVYARAAAAGTPFISFFTPGDIKALAAEAGFARSETLGAADLAQRYFANRTDGLEPAEGECFLIARTK